MSSTTADLGRTAVRPWSWLAARPARSLSCALLLTCALRLPFLSAPFGDDEGGYLYVAQHWPGPGHWLYGRQWVDRPPVLVLIFKLVAVLGASPVAMRLVAMALACLLVLGAWYVGRRIAGRDGALAAGLVAAALASDPVILGNELNSDGIGAAFGTVSFALLLAAIDRHESSDSSRWQPLGLAGLAGLVAALAFLSKQSAVLGLVAAGLVLAFRLPARARLLVAYALGVLVPLAATVVWAATGPGLGMLVNAIYTFRVTSAQVVAASAARAPQQRFWVFLGVVVISGMVLPLAYLAYDALSRRHRPAVRLGVAVAAGVLVAVIAASLNWYSYYLLAVVPLAAVGMALAFARGRRQPRFRWLPKLVVLATVAVVAANVLGQLPVPQRAPLVSRFVSAAATPRDSMIVIWGQPNLMEDAGLRSPYPYSWALPARVEDPRLRLFARTLAGASAPTWLLQVGRLREWGMGTPLVHRLVTHRYHVVARVCGHPIWLRDGLRRPLSRAEALLGGPC